MPAACDAVRSANRLYLTTLALAIVLGGSLQLWKQWPGLIATEILCILLPTLHFATTRPGIHSTLLRLRWTGWGPCWMSLVAGAACFPAAIGAGWVGQKALGYDLKLPDSFWPAGPLETTVYVIGTAVAAPVCEELLFRGYILGAYERSGLRPAVLVAAVAALFTAYHVSPSRAASVGVFAIAITWIGWRTGSVWPAVVAHMGVNGSAALLVLYGRGRQWPQIGWLAAVCGIMVASTLALLLIVRLPAAAAGCEIEASPAVRRAWRPLWVAGAVITVIAAIEVAMCRIIGPQ